MFIMYDQLHIILQGVLNGYNGTVMAYGQTGTGKTYTVGRLGKDDAAERGIMVRAMEDIMANTSSISEIVEMSYLQVLQCCLYLQWYFIFQWVLSIFFST